MAAKQPELPIEVSQEPLMDPMRPGQERKRRFVTVVRAERWWVEKARVDPAFFIHYVTGQEPAKHMRMWLANIFHPERKRINIIAPRESAKSTTMIGAMAYYIGRFPLSTNAIISVSSKQAEERMRAIKALVVDNPRYHNVFPRINVDNHFPITQTEFTVWSSQNTYNNWRRAVSKYGNPMKATLTIAGRGGSAIIGSRYSGLVLLDDIIDDKDLTPAAQDAVLQYIMQTLEPCVKEEGKIISICTRWMLGDVPESLKNNPEWHTIEIRATLYDQNGNPHSYWPEYWPLEKLAAKRRKMDDDALYKIMYECDPTALAKALFLRHELKRDLPPKLPQLTGIYISTDWAASLKTAADFTVFQVFGIDADNNVYMFDMKRLKTDFPSAVQALVAFSRETADKYGRLDGILVENVGFQASIEPTIRSTDHSLPVISVVPKGDKLHRAGVVSDWVRREKYFINQSISDLDYMIGEWMNFGAHPHDDTLDAASLLFQHLNLCLITAEVSEVHSEFLI
jgi:predicted phage terminase large subunit-like protein